MHIHSSAPGQATVREIFTRGEVGDKVAKVDICWDPQIKQQVAFLSLPGRRHSQVLAQIMSDAREKLRTDLTFLAAAKVFREGESDYRVEIGGSGFCRATYGFDKPGDPQECEALLAELLCTFQQNLDLLGLPGDATITALQKQEQLLLTMVV
jgi:hypothetical protein